MTFTTDLVDAVYKLSTVLEEHTTDVLGVLALNHRQLATLLHDASLSHIASSVILKDSGVYSIVGVPIKAIPLAGEKEKMFVPYPELGIIRYTREVPMGVTGSEFMLQFPRVDYNSTTVCYREYVHVPFTQCRLFDEVLWVTSYKEYNWILL